MEDLNGEGNIIILNGMSGITSAVDRRAGVQEILEKYPNIKVLGEEYSDWYYAKGKIATENLLAAFPEIARAVIYNPKIFIMDETTATLSEQEVYRLFDII